MGMLVYGIVGRDFRKDCLEGEKVRRTVLETRSGEVATRSL